MARYLKGQINKKVSKVTWVGESTTVESARIIIVHAQIIQEFSFALTAPLEAEHEAEFRGEAIVASGGSRQGFCYFMHFFRL